ncbi:MAG: hypothetical protein E7K04_04990 [Helicobacter sp.]|nr:hypothetical protein [Helicobacter sp.]
MAEVNLTPEDIINRLKERGADLNCQHCKSDKIGIPPGFGVLLLQDKLDGNVIINTPHIPVVYLICDNCGAMAPHALGALGFMQNEQNEN